MSRLARVRAALGIRREPPGPRGTLIRRMGLGRRRPRWCWR